METNDNRVPLPMETPTPHPEPTSGGSPLSSGLETSPSPATATNGPVDVNDLEEKIIAALRTCFDPEVPVNIYEMGLIYDIVVDPAGAVQIKMTLTSPACPVAGSLPPEVQAKVSAVPGVASTEVDVVWDPPWTQDRMSEAARLQLGLF